MAALKVRVGGEWVTVITEVDTNFGFVGDTISVSSNYSPAICTDGLLEVDTTAGDVTITLPTAVGVENCPVSIKKMVAANTMVVQPTGAETIDGDNDPINIVVQDETITVVSNNADWLVI
jgi:hypothetical protein